jgi:hypothetical protein
VNLLHFKVYGIFFLLAWLVEKYSNFLLLFCRAIPLGATQLWTQNGGAPTAFFFAEKSFCGKSAKHNLVELLESDLLAT